MEEGKKVERLKNWKGTVSLGSWPTIERRDETYYDPSFCPLAARNKHLLRHRVKGEEGWRRAIDVDCRGTRSPPVHATYFPSKSFLLPRSHFPQKGMAVYSPDERKLPSRERPWATPRWQEDVVRAIALCPNEGPLIFTSDAGKWPVRKRARKEGKRERKKEKGRGRGPPSNRPAGRGNDSLLSILDLSHFYSHPHEPRDYAFSFQFTRVFSSIVSRSSYHLQLRGKTFRRNGNEYQPDTMPNM